MELTHINKQGRAKMVDVSEKEDTNRHAAAAASIYMKRETLSIVAEGKAKKGDVLSVAQVAGIMAAKNTANIIPMCHSINITGCDIEFTLDFEKSKIDIEASARISGKTGVEMEALVATSTAALTIYDMCKAVDRGMVISDVMLVEKSGGKSGLFKRKL